MEAYLSGSQEGVVRPNADSKMLTKGDMAACLSGSQEGVVRPNANEKVEPTSTALVTSASPEMVGPPAIRRLPLSFDAINEAEGGINATSQAPRRTPPRDIGNAAAEAALFREKVMIWNSNSDQTDTGAFSDNEDEDELNLYGGNVKPRPNSPRTPSRRPGSALAELSPGSRPIASLPCRSASAPPATECILLVDDCPIILIMVSALLEKNNMEVHTAVNGREALKRMQERDYDLVLTDANMPKMAGLEMIAEMRSREAKRTNSRRSPVIVMSAGMTEEEIKHQMSTGADDFMAKPVRQEVMLQKIREQIDSYPWTRQQAGASRDDHGGDSKMDHPSDGANTRVPTAPSKAWPRGRGSCGSGGSSGGGENDDSKADPRGIVAQPTGANDGDHGSSDGDSKVDTGPSNNPTHWALSDTMAEWRRELKKDDAKEQRNSPSPGVIGARSSLTLPRKLPPAEVRGSHNAAMATVQRGNRVGGDSDDNSDSPPLVSTMTTQPDDDGSDGDPNAPGNNDGGGSENKKVHSTNTGASTSPPRNLLVSQGSVLVVDDSPVMRQTLTALLVKDGYEVDTARDGLEALMRLQERQYDVVLSDVNMPVLGGKAMAAEMREREESSGQHQRVIFMSAPMTDTEMKRVLSTGADGYVTKPVQVEAMRQMFRPGTPMLRAIRDGASEELKGESEGMVKLSRSDREKEKGSSA